MTKHSFHGWDLAVKLVAWQRQHGRQHLPWQHTQDPYRVWLSEIMLQQTQVTTVIGYYERFLHAFPTVQALANATQDEVMPYWAGLGYYARARNVHRCAQIICTEYGGQFPSQSQTLATLPGIGRSTAAAIAAFCFGERAPIMDGNVKRVFTRFFGVEGHPQQRAVEQKLWALAEQVLAYSPADLNMAHYTQSLMDLGSLICTRRRPTCEACPLKAQCYAFAHGLTEALPTPKVRPSKPERSVQMLIVQTPSHVLLTQRPSEGIWGGLQVPLLFETKGDLEQMLRTHQASTHALEVLQPFWHVFSHFKLHIHPYLLSCHQPWPVEDAQFWLPREAISKAALPAPVKKVFAALALAAQDTRLFNAH